MLAYTLGRHFFFLAQMVLGLVLPRGLLVVCLVGGRMAKKSSSQRGGVPPDEARRLVTLFQQGAFLPAETLSRQLVQRFPRDGLGWTILGALLKQQGRLDEALSVMQKTTTLLPYDAAAWSNLGATQQALGLVEAAEHSLRQSLKLQPHYANAHNNLGLVFKQQDRLLEAEASLRRAIALSPDYAEAHYNLALVLEAQHNAVAAEDSYRRAIQCFPDFAAAYHNLGMLLRDQSRYAEAHALYLRAIALQPDYPEAWSNLANLQKDLGQLPEAGDSYRQALVFKPDYADAHSNLLFCLAHRAGLSPAELFAEHLRFGEQFEAPLRAGWQPHPNDRHPDRPIRVGLVSGDLRNHAIAHFLEPLISPLAALAPQAGLVLVAYSNHPIEDAVTQRLKGYFAEWHNIAALSDAVLAEQVRADRIDILIDLSSHTTHNRLLTFARKPAPVQVSWMGYPGTTGLQAMDYYFADRFFLPPETFAAQFTEQLVMLPASAAFESLKDAPEINPLPAQTTGKLTFGSFNRLSKLNPSIIGLWAKLLHALPESKLLIGGLLPEGQETLLGWFKDAAIRPDRLILQPRCSIVDYLKLHHQVDLCLDAFPYTGGTTTNHGLWMGVPTLTLAGQTPASRQGASLMGHVGLPEFIAHNEAEFVEKGLYWASHLAELAAIRAGLRQRWNASAIGQPALVAQGIAAALRTIWQGWCDDQLPRGFTVEYDVTAASSARPLAHTASQTELPLLEKSPHVSAPSEGELAQLVGLYQQGRTAEAEYLARQLCRQHPKHGLSWKILGILLLQQGQSDAAVPVLQQAADCLPQDVEVQGNLGVLLLGQSAWAAAAVCFERLLRALPNDAATHYNLGLAYENQGLWSQAETCYQQALQHRPDYAKALNNLGSVLKAQGKVEAAEARFRAALACDAAGVESLINLGSLVSVPVAEAETHLRRACQLAPHNPAAWTELGLVLQRQEKWDDAAACYQKAVHLQPDWARYNNLGLVWLHQNHLSKSEDALRQALALSPDNAVVLNNLGNTLKAQGRLSEAVACLRQAVAQRSEDAECQNNLGLALHEQDQFTEAEACFRQALMLKPDYAEAWSNLGTLLKDCTRFGEAEAAFRQALALQPVLMQAHNNLGITLKDQGRLPESEASFRLALALDPFYEKAFTNLLLLSQYAGHLSQAEVQALHREFGDRFEAPFRGKARPSFPPHSAGVPLRVGFVSADLRAHAVSYFLLPLLAALDPKKVEVVVYHNATREDAVSAALRQHCLAWHGVLGMDDDALAAQICADKIEVLVDLSGHTAHNRLLVFARQPAPVQVTWLGYPNTTGLQHIDWRLTDGQADLPSADADYTEKLWRLPEVFACYQPLVDAPERRQQAAYAVRPTPALTQGTITFGCCNNYAKITPQVVALWAQVLLAVPRSRLLLELSGDDVVWAEALNRFAEVGISAERLILVERDRSQQYLTYHAIDIALDPFPANGGTTSCDTLWMGVPLVTLAGEHFIARLGVSFISAIGHPEWIAQTEADYVQIACTLAADIEKLNQTRLGLRATVEASPLMDGQRFARHIEAAFLAMRTSVAAA